MERMTLRRRLFGYSLEDMSKVLDDRDRMFGEVNRRAQAAEDQLAAALAKQAEKDREIVALRQQVDELQERLGSLTDQSAELEELRRQMLDLRSDPLTQAVAGDVIVKFLIAEVAPVLKAAEESAVAMLEDAGAESRSRLDQVEEARRKVHEQVEWLSSWRDRMDPLIRRGQQRIAETRQRLGEIPDRIREALHPVTDSMTSANQELTEFVRAATPPSPPRQSETAVAPEEDAVYVDVPAPSWPGEEQVAAHPEPEPAWWGM